MRKNGEQTNAVAVIDHGTTPAVRTAVTPMDLLSIAMDQNADLDKLERLMTMQLTWEANEAKKAYNQSMSRFRELCPTISKSREGHNQKRYAGLAETIEQIKPILSTCGLSHQWKTRQENSVVTVECTVTHIMGHSETTSLSAAPDTSGSKNSIQAIGSTISYLERYTLFAILGLASREMDDDGVAVDAPVVEYISEAQCHDLEALLTEVGANIRQFCLYLQVPSVDLIPADKYKFAVAAIERKRKV